MRDSVKRARKHAKDVLDPGYPYYGTPELVREMADAMLREREPTNHDAAPERGDALAYDEAAARLLYERDSANDELSLLRRAVRQLLDGVNERHPEKPPREWVCNDMALLDRLVPPNHDASPEAIAGTPGTGDTQSFDAYRRFVGEVMNWISEATSAADWSSDGGRKIMAQACSRCWDAFDRIAYPTDHGAAPEARASAESVAPQPTAGDGAGNPPSHSGTGDTPKPQTTPGECSVPLEGTQEPVAWGVANGKGLLAASISRIDAVDMQSYYACDTAVVPLYRHPPVTKPMPQEKQAEVSDRSKPITGPDPDSRVWGTHTPATHATHGEGSVRRECTEPVAWAVACDYGDYGVALFSDEASAQTEADRRALVGLRPGYVVVPLYRSPTLTDAEREALVEMALVCDNRERKSLEFKLPEEAARWRGMAATLRGLLAARSETTNV